MLILPSWFFYFFVDVRDHQHVYVGWRAGHLLFIAFAPLVGFACQEYWRAGGATRGIGIAATLVLIAAAAPTAAIDLYDTQDTSNRQEAAGFHWTLVIPPDELEALDWLRHRPGAFGPRGETLLPSLAKYRIIKGLWHRCMPPSILRKQP